MRYAPLVAMGMALGLVGSARAALLGLELADSPDMTSGLIDVTYDAFTDDFAADGFALAYDDDGVGIPEDVLNGSFSITASIDDSGLDQGGTLSLAGDVLAFGPSLLTGDLIGFGFEDAGGQLLEFLFVVTGGDLAGDYGGLGAEVGVILDLNSGAYSGDWSQSFDNLAGGVPGTGTGVSDTAPLVPAPAALGLLAAAALGRRRRRA